MFLIPSEPVPSCASTQELCGLLARDGAPEGATVRAIEQTAGRGRGDRSWHSGAGHGLWMSFLLRPRLPGADWPALTALTVLALSEALESLPSTPPDWRGRVKWPNDLFGRKGKLAGILAEVADEALIIGLGVNTGHHLEDFPEDLRGRASSLRVEGFDPVPSPDAVFAAFDGRFRVAYDRFCRGDREFLRAGLRERFLLDGCRVRLEGPGAGEPLWVLEGIARDVGAMGELLLVVEGGIRTVVSGEVAAWVPAYGGADKPGAEGPGAEGPGAEAPEAEGSGAEAPNADGSGADGSGAFDAIPRGPQNGPCGKGG